MAIDASNAQILPSFLAGCHTLRELSIDWLPVGVTSEVQLIDAIPRGCIQSLRVMPDSIFWHYMWRGHSSDKKPSKFMAQYKGLAKAILRLGMRNSGRKISVWFVIPRAPYIMREPIMECVIALWKEVEDMVSFGFQMTETEPVNSDKRHPITNLA